MSGEISIRRYTQADLSGWNAFVQSAANATFLHDRRFMEYHSDRFADCSLVIEREGKLLALLPASLKDDVLTSHGGLTYGGLLVQPKFAASDMLEVVERLKQFLHASGIAKLVYKPTPHIFHTQPSEADIYGLVNAGAQLIGAELATVVPMRQRIPFNSLRKRGVKKAQKAGLVVEEVRDFASFWEILSEVLDTRHDASPTHTLEEIELLAARFPEQIRLFASTLGEKMLAGMVVFDFGHAVHAQYIASSSAGRDVGALDLLVHDLLENVFADRTWFSFGISTTNGGKHLNKGLSRQKEMFGGHSVVFGRYELAI